MCENNCGCYDDDYPRWSSLFQHYYLGNKISGRNNLTLDRDSHDVVLSEEVTASRTIMATDANFDSYAVSWVGNRLTKWTKNRSEIWDVLAPTTLEFTAAIRIDANFDVYLLNRASLRITKYSGVDGSIIWTSPSGLIGSANGLTVTPDGYSAFVGSVSGQGAVVAFDPDGAQLWLASGDETEFDVLSQGIFWEDSSSNLWYGAGGFAANGTTETVPWLGELNVATGAIETLYTKDLTGSSFHGDRSFATGLHTCPNSDVVMSYRKISGGEFTIQSNLYAMRFTNGVTPDPDSPQYDFRVVEDSGSSSYCSAIDSRSYHFVGSSEGIAVVQPNGGVDFSEVIGGDFVSVDGGEPHIFPVHPGS